MITNLINSIYSEFPQAKTQIEEFPSGAIFLYIFLNKRGFVLLSHKSLFSIDELKDDDPPFVDYYKFNSKNYEEAKACLFQLLTAA